MKKIPLFLILIFATSSCGLIPVLPNFEKKYSPFKGQNCILTKAINLEKSNRCAVRKYELQSTTSQYPEGSGYTHAYIVPKGSTIKIISVVTIDYGFGFYTPKARAEYIDPLTNQKVKFEIHLDMYDPVPLQILKVE